MYYVICTEVYANARNEAAQHALQRNFLFREAARAFSSVLLSLKHPHSHRFRDMVILQRNLLNVANGTMSKCIWPIHAVLSSYLVNGILPTWPSVIEIYWLYARNQHLPSNTMDLHGLYVDEAIVCYLLYYIRTSVYVDYLCRGFLHGASNKHAIKESHNYL